MSYILDALKRSEQERHQGELIHPTIDTIMLKAKPVKHQWWPYLLIVVLLTNLGVYLYFQFSQSQAVEREGSKPSIVHQPTVHPSDIESPPVLNNRGSASVHEETTISTAIVDVPAVKPLPTHVLQTPNLNKFYDHNQINTGSKERALSSNDKQAEPAVNRSAQPLIQNEYNDEGLEVIRPKQYDAAQKSVMPVALEKQNTPQAFSEAPAVQNIPENFELIEPTREILHANQLPASTETESHSDESVSPMTNTDSFESIQHLNDLSEAFQKTVPNIRFNSHIYSDQPTERRVIINDLYLKEGQSFSGMKIITIGEFYIELEKQGQNFKLPVLRDWFTPG